MKTMKLVVIGSVVVFGLLVAVLVQMSHPPASLGGEESLLVYCAAGAKMPMVKLARQFEEEYGVRVELQYGGSGTLLSNLQVSKQGDLYLAADVSYMEIAQEKGVVAEMMPIAKIRPVIAVAQGNPKGIAGLDDLLRDDVRLAVGNPDAASIGKQTKTLLSASGYWDGVKERIEQDGVFKPTVPEVANDVKIGAVDAGVVWDCTVNQYEELEMVRVPEFEAAVKAMTVGVLNSSQQPTLALRFARYLSSQVGNQVFAECGYEAGEGDAWAWHPEVTFFCGAVNRRSVEQVVARFAEREGVTVNTMYNGCGILTAQMRTLRDDESEGFPDVYMACDRYYLETVQEWFVEDVDVSDNRLVIITPEGNPLGIESLADLGKKGVRLAVGQPEQCTIGALTRRLLEKEGLTKPVMANVLTQAASSAMLVPAVTTGSVDAAIAYNTDAQAEEEKLTVIAITSESAKAVQPFSLAASTEHRELGRRLLEAIRGARDEFEAAGFHYLLDDGHDE